MTERLYVDVHVLQTVPPSNLNRDDAGTPKQAVYGGVRRARVSSQAWKRATRKAFADQLEPHRLATRTKQVSSLVARHLRERSGLTTEDALRVAVALLATSGIKPDKKKPDETPYLFFIGRSQVERLAELVAGEATSLASLSDKELEDAVKPRASEVRNCLAAGHSLDVALFGRMVADVPALNVDAATQVAHALSTHPVEIEFDYFTAVDDENVVALDDEKGNTGAGMIGTVEFNSATLYRYATLGVHQLADNLGGDVEAALEGLRLFLECFVTSMPTGHQNTFAHRTAPDLVAITVRADQPVNLVSAFESPVRAGAGGFSNGSMQLLAQELKQSSQLWGLTPSLVVATYGGEELDGLGAAVPFADGVGRVVDRVRTDWAHA